MLKWKAWLSISVLSLGLMGCGYGAGSMGTKAMNDQSGSPQTYSKNSIYQSGTMGIRGAAGDHAAGPTSYGFVNYSKQDMHAQQASSFFVDRNVLARTVATVVNSIPEVQNASVLVTDEDIFVGVNGVKDVSTLNKVKLSAWSVSPRYYKVYVTSDAKTISQVQTLVANSNNRQTFDETKLESILKNNTIDMTGTNVTDSGQNRTNYNIHQSFPNTNGTNKMR